MPHGGSDQPEMGRPPRSAADRRAAFESAAAIEDETERALEAASVIAEDLGELGLKPVVVGGLAVAYWTAGIETTGDIDVVVPVSNETLDERLGALGMEPVGRVWATPDRRVSFERPGDSLRPGWRAIDAESPSGRPLRVLSLEDTIVARMEEVESTGQWQSWNQALTMLRVPGLDRTRLEARSQQERIMHVLARLDWAAAEVEKGRIFTPAEVHDFFPTFREPPTI